MLTSININGLQSYAYHGLIEEERRLGQKFVLDLKANLRETPTHRDDELVASVRYDSLVEETLNLTQSSQFQTLEALGEQIARGLLGRFAQIESVLVKVAKFSPPIPAAVEQVGVEIGLSRRDLSSVDP
jgi:7,8-dihydroneopterin aldolase/epimerase/oxygenase